MTDTYRWWQEKGAEMFNRQFIEMTGHEIGSVPLSNLKEETEMPEDADLDVIAMLLEQEHYQVYRCESPEGRTEDLLIRIL